jgi:NAD(P)-dependent dehydrogenase (short-subunit alcohol dehydrogenase family)
MHHPEKLLRGKVALITGGSTGIGFYTALELAKKGASIIIVGHNKNHCEEAVEKIKQTTGQDNIVFYTADLSSKNEIVELSKNIHDDFDKLDILINNVGRWFTKYQENTDGIEMTFALNHLSYFLLTGLMLDLLQETGEARIINVSSTAHNFPKTIQFDNLNFKDDFRLMKVYGHSKLANILFTYQLADRLNGNGITVNALHPGFVRSNLYRDYGIFGPVILFLAKLFGKDPQEGARTSVYLASSEDVTAMSGKYFVEEKEKDSSAISYDKDLQKRLWDISEELTGFTYPM